MTAKTPDILIFGAGSMGTALGAYLAKAGIAADLVARDKEHVEALKTTGAKISGTDFFSTKPFDGGEGRGLAMFPREIQKKYDIVFLLTRQRDNPAAAAALKNHILPNGVVCTLQNGLPEPALAEILGGEKVLGCVCVWGAEKTAPGEVNLTSEPRGMSFGLGSLFAEDHPMLLTARDILEKICPVAVEKNFIGVRWGKLLLNAAFSGLSAVTGYNFGQIAADRRARRCALYVIKECINVCDAAEIKIEPVQGKNIKRLLDFNNSSQKLRASIVLRFAIRKHRAVSSGMLRDLDLGRACEIEEINGVAREWGKKYNVPTPFNNKIVEIVRSIERGERKYNPENLALF